MFRAYAYFSPTANRHDENAVPMRSAAVPTFANADAVLQSLLVTPHFIGGGIEGRVGTGWVVCDDEDDVRNAVEEVLDKVGAAEVSV